MQAAMQQDTATEELSWLDFVQCLPVFFNTKGSAVADDLLLIYAYTWIFMRDGTELDSYRRRSGVMMHSRRFALMHERDSCGCDVLSHLGKRSLEAMRAEDMDRVYLNFCHVLNAYVRYETMAHQAACWMDTVLAHIEKLRRARGVANPYVL